MNISLHGAFSFRCGRAHPAKAGPIDSTIPQVFDHMLKQAFRRTLWPESTYSVEKLISCAPRISQVNQIVAENPAQTSTLAHYDRLRRDIVSNGGSFRSSKLQAF
jgi:hypothetical protein